MIGSFRLDGSPMSTVEIDNRAFLYGDGFFTTMRVHEGTVQLWQYHLQRIVQSADALFLSVDSYAVQAAVVAHAKALSHGLIKLHVSRQSDGVRGYAISTQDTHVVITTSQLPDGDYGQPVSLQHSAQAAVLPQRLSLVPENLAGLKTLNRLDNVMAAHALHEAQVDYPEITQGIVCGVNELVAEGVSGNLFFYHDDMWLTPSVQHAGVAGTFRQAVLDAMDVAVVDLPLSQLHAVEAAFLCNAVRGIQPLSSIYDVQHNTYISEQLDTQVVTHLHTALCDNARFMTHFTR